MTILEKALLYGIGKTQKLLEWFSPFLLERDPETNNYYYKYHKFAYDTDGKQVYLGWSVKINLEDCSVMFSEPYISEKMIPETYRVEHSEWSGWQADAVLTYTTGGGKFWATRNARIVAFMEYQDSIRH